jgi:hypothetical protein
MAIVGVVGDDDDDGNAAVGKEVGKAIGSMSGPITPTDGAWERVAKDRHEPLRRIGNGVIDFFAAGESSAAYEYFEEQNLSADEKIAIWTMLDSKQRAALKKLHKERTQPEAA